MVARICNKNIFLALETWKQTVREAAREKRIMIKTLSRLEKRSLMSCFEWWKDATCESTRQRSVTGKMVARICNKNIFLVLETWKQTVGEKKIMIKTLSRLQKNRLQNSSLMSCFACWKVVAFEKWANEANNTIENQNLAAPERCVCISRSYWAMRYLGWKHAWAHQCKLLLTHTRARARARTHTRWHTYETNSWSLKWIFAEKWYRRKCLGKWHYRRILWGSLRCFPSGLATYGGRVSSLCSTNVL